MKRNLTLDLTRGFTVLMIAPIHTVMLFSKLSVRETLLGNFLAFVAEWHGAQIFMTIMGISFVFAKNQTLESAVKKAGLLMVFAYVLNIFKFVIPHFFGWLPAPLLVQLQIDPGIHGYTRLFAVGDILHFATIAILVMGIVCRFKEYDRVAAWMAVAICFTGPWLWDASSDNGFAHYGLQIIGGQPPAVFFPLLPWLVYPLLGLYLGKMLQKAHSLNSNQNPDSNQRPWFGFDSFWIAGLSLILLAATIKYFLHEESFSSFYRTTPLDTLLHVGFTLIVLSCWHWVSIYVKPNGLFRLFSYASRHITQVYIIQWILVCWLLPFINYQQSGLIGSLFLILLTSIMTLTISLIIDLVKSSQPKTK
jgi:uncharacterized membrane protein